ncbi:MAG: TauD/TfdA family dioxygenase [Pseudomonadota bacterium]
MAMSERRYEISSSGIENRKLVLTWGDGHRSSFHPMWLRHQCECADCGTSLDAIRGVRLHHIPDDIAPLSAEATGNGVTIVWNGGGHVSTYSAKWLRDHCYSEDERALRRSRPVLWTGSLSPVPTFDYGQMQSDPAVRLSMLKAVRDTGFCKVTGVPPEKAHASSFIELVGPQRQTHYGTYDLASKKSTDNVGDTSGPLDPHTDETYRLSSIGITVFQVMRPSSNGGASTLVDGFEAARRLREAAPDDFDLLTRLPITTQRLDRGANSGGQQRWFVARLPVIKLDFEGEIAGVRLNERQIAPLDIPAELIGPCYRALKKIFELVYEPELRLTFPLEAGEGLIFDNQRCLHGRTGYVPETPPRSVLTSSVDLEEFHSTLRTLEMATGKTGPQMLYAQGINV